MAEPDRTLRAEIPITAHVHDCFEIGYCYQGSGIFIVENKILSFQAGDAVVINHRELHTMKGSPGSLTDWYFLNLAPVELLAGLVREDDAVLETEHLSGPDFDNILHADTDPGLCRIVAALITEMKNRQSGYRSVVRALVWEMMVCLHRKIPAEPRAADQVSRQKLALVSPAIRYITDHYHEPIAMGIIARKCGYSVSNFRKVFNAATGSSPQDYIKRLRLEAAASMLRHSRESILNIALKSGYPTLSNFNRQFHQHFGVGPREWRQSRNHTQS